MRRSLPPVLALLTALLLASPAVAQREFGFDNTKPSGQDYISPEETVKRMKVAPEFEVKLFAGEPNCVNPIAFTIDEKGRVWVVECFEYPSRTPKGKAPRDRIVILEDTDGDGACDRRTVFAEGKDFPVPEERKKQGLGAFDLASGIEVGNGGVYVGAPPYLWFIENKDDRPGKFETLLSGFGSEDTHEMLNTFQWGPDGWLYGLHGVFTNSEVKSLDGPETRMNAAVWRFHPKTKKFEIFAEGTSNPWGMDWRNTDGQFIVCCCVIPHLFHVVPGGIYKRQAGASFNPYAYSYIDEICDHTFHRESGWAHAGLISLDVPHVPEKYRDSVIFGSIHGCSIKRNTLKPNGSTYTASKAEDFLVSGDKNFRPINMKWGPNGDIYLIDWHDQNPCHQAKPDAWDYERGRVYRVQLKGTKTKKAEDMAKYDLGKLVEACHTGNPYQQRTAWRLLGERWREADSMEYVKLLFQFADKKIAAPAYQVSCLFSEKFDDTMSALRWLKGMTSPNAPVKPEFMGRHAAGLTWTIRNAVNYGGSEAIVETMTKAAGQDWPASVRREFASAAIQLAGKHDVTPLLHALMARKEDANDPVIPHLVWYAYEKVIANKASGGRKPPVKDTPRNEGDEQGEGTQQGANAPRSPDAELTWLKDHAAGNLLVTNHIIPKVMRRLVAMGEPEDLALCVKFAAGLTDAAARRAALEGLTVALNDQMIDAPAGWAEAQKTLLASKDPGITALVNKLAVSFRDPAALKRAFDLFHKKDAPVELRAESLRQLVRLRHADAAKLVQSALRDEELKVRAEAAQQLAAIPQPDVAAAVVRDWKDFPKAIRPELVNSLASRKESAKALLEALAAGTIDRADVTDNVIVRIQAFKDRELNQLVEKHWGRTRPTPKELDALIAKMRKELASGPASFARGKLVFENQCAKCHKFDGNGADVGPVLDGAARDVEYILANVIDPNRVIGAPYFQRIVKTLDGRVEQGLLAGEDDKSITLKLEKGETKRFAKDDLDGPVTVVEQSMMPEGLTAGMSTQDFRDLVRYVMVNPYLTHVSMDGEPVRVGVTGNIRLPYTGAATVEAEVTATEDVKTQLQLAGVDEFEVLLDGKSISKGTGSSAVDVALPKGTHTLTLAVKGKSLTARLLDPERKLNYPDAGAKK